MKKIIPLLLTLLGNVAYAQVVNKSFYYIAYTKPAEICATQGELVLRFINKDSVLIEHWLNKKCSLNAMQARTIICANKHAYKIVDKQIIHIQGFEEFGNLHIQEKKLVAVNDKKTNLPKINFDAFDYNAWISPLVNNKIKATPLKNAKLIIAPEMPPNGTFIFTVKDFEASKTGIWKVIIKGNKATIYSLGLEIWDTTAKKGDILGKPNIIKFKGKWISVNDNELYKDFEATNGAQFETWDFKNKIVQGG